VAACAEAIPGIARITPTRPSAQPENLNVRAISVIPPTRGDAPAHRIVKDSEGISKRDRTTVNLVGALGIDVAWVSSLSISLHRSYDDAEMRLLSVATTLICLTVPTLAIGDGEESFETRCALCHGGDAAGTDRAASIIPILQTSATDRLSTIITEGVA
ncbi:uncharacterized protein METZ01_LOCUS72040, partial [marine metagenome]